MILVEAGEDGLSGLLTVEDLVLLWPGEEGGLVGDLTVGFRSGT